MASTSKSKRAAKKSPKEIGAESKKPQLKGEAAKSPIIIDDPHDCGAASKSLLWSFFSRGPGESLTEINSSRRPLNRIHSTASVAVVIRGLESLSETLPAVLQVANGSAPQGIRYVSRDTLTAAIEMLTSYRYYREARESESDSKMLVDAITQAKTEGIALGIEQEKQRVKEARRGRK